MAAILIVVFAWAYWPTWLRLVAAWDTQPDYSHGYLVVPIALYFLWARRASFPGWRPLVGWGGVLLLAASIGLRVLSAYIYIDAVDAWSMVLWLAGCVWLLCGFRVLRWSAPSIVFLLFMIPLPWSAERALSYPLQRIALHLSSWSLQSLGYPVVAEGNVLWMGNDPIQIAEACSGLRIFVGVFALAYAYLVIVPRAWWERALLLLSAVPVALVANAARIIVTCMLFQSVSGEWAHRFLHDLSGWAMIPLAAALFGLVLAYLRLLVPEVEPLDVGAVARRHEGKITS